MKLTLVSFIPVSIKLSFPSWFSYTCCCVLVQSPPGSVGKQAGTLLTLLFFFFFLEVSAKRNNVTDIEFCFQKENLRGLENGGLNQGDCPVWARQGPPHFLLLFSPLLSVCLLSTVGA